MMDLLVLFQIPVVEERILSAYLVTAVHHLLQFAPVLEDVVALHYLTPG